MVSSILKIRVMVEAQSSPFPYLTSAPLPRAVQRSYGIGRTSSQYLRAVTSPLHRCMQLSELRYRAIVLLRFLGLGILRQLESLLIWRKGVRVELEVKECHCTLIFFRGPSFHLVSLELHPLNSFFKSLSPT